MASPIPKFQTLITVNCEFLRKLLFTIIFFMKVKEFRELVNKEFESTIDFLFEFNLYFFFKKKFLKVKNMIQEIFNVLMK
jgi:hypothetical protein